MTTEMFAHLSPIEIHQHFRKIGRRIVRFWTRYDRDTKQDRHYVMTVPNDG